jgi:hypothetical protein
VGILGGVMGGTAKQRGSFEQRKAQAISEGRVKRNPQQQEYLSRATARDFPHVMLALAGITAKRTRKNLDK